MGLKSCQVSFIGSSVIAGVGSADVDTGVASGARGPESASLPATPRPPAVRMSHRPLGGPDPQRPRPRLDEATSIDIVRLRDSVPADIQECGDDCEVVQ